MRGCRFEPCFGFGGYRVKALVTEDLHGRFCYFNSKPTIIERLREKYIKVHER